MKNRPLASFKYLKIFSIFLLLTILFSLIYKGVLLIRASRFNGYSFTVLAFNKDAHIINIDKRQNRLSLITIKNAGEKLSKDNILKTSLLLKVPIDAALSYQDSNILSKNFKNEFFSLSFLFSVLSHHNLYTLSNLNDLDLFKLYIGEKFIPSANKNIEEKKDLEEFANDTKILFQLFKDDSVINEKISLEITNSSGVDGLASIFKKMLENVGFHVISVTTETESKNSRILTSINENDSTKNLEKFLSFPIEKRNGTSVADVSIILGTDLKKLK